MLIKEWLPGFLAWHQNLWPDAGWPHEDSAESRRMWSDWLQAFMASHMTEVEATAAAKRIGECPWSEHHDRIVELVIAARERAAIRAGTQADLSGQPVGWDCPWCHDDGLALVYDPKYDGRPSMMRLCRLPDGSVTNIPFAMRVAAHCVCDKGRWLRRECTTDLLPRIPDYAEAIAHQSRWQITDPTRPEPIPMPEGMSQKDYWRYLVEHFRKGDEGTGGPIHAPGGVPEEN